MEIGLNVLLCGIVVLLVVIAWRLGNIDSRLKDQFPTAEERSNQSGIERPYDQPESQD